VRRFLLLLLVVGLAGPSGAARGDSGTFAIVPDTFALPASSAPNGPDLALAPAWLAPPSQPVQLSYGQLLALWQSAGQAYGVPWNVLAAINKIESNFGRNMGPSSAGAIGWMQFMPATWLLWGSDANADGVADPWNPVDAVYSAARYLAAAGAATDIRQAVFSYNHAIWYVNEVMALAQLYGGSGGSGGSDGQTLFALDELQSQLADAQAAVTRASEAYRVAEAGAQAFADREQAATARVAAEQLLSDQLEAQRRAGQIGAYAYAARADADRLQGELQAAQAALTRLQQQAQAGAFNQPAGQLLSAAPASTAGNYVFPVGGGASAVSVSHFHHDYPAADIAAPEGSPLYALSDGTVLAAWPGDARCGIGFTFLGSDGQTWTYCHLSYLYPSVQPRAALRAGDPVGLVGATGDTTGPHLHLQLQPATSYPQDEQWFQSFAGTAFHWSDEAGTAGAPPAPLVFHIVSPGEATQVTVGSGR
jgi:murein DD-endopeptidase MepM/ murein hydrolase activator NlpD